jgi:antiphage defense system Thoeris ThsB-like protein
MPTTKKRVFISFDVDNDNGAKVMLAGQAAHPDSPFDFKDASVKEHLPGDWKEKVRSRMNNIDLVIFLCGTKTNLATGVAHELTITLEKKVPFFYLAAYGDKNCVKPSGANASDKVYKWEWENLKRLIGGAR